MTTDVRGGAHAQAAGPRSTASAVPAFQPPDAGAAISDIRLPQPDALLSTKLSMPPARSALVRRPRLTARLSAALHGSLTLLVAPAGFGKTTLLAGWYADRGEDAASPAWTPRACRAATT
jgi:hypothetical protein